MGLIKFSEDILFKLNPFQVSTYIFTDAGPFNMHKGNLIDNASVLISFVAPTSGQRLTLRLKHSGKEDAPLEITLGLTIIQLNPSSKSSLTIDDITLYPFPGPSQSDHLSFEPGTRNNIVIQFRGPVRHHHFLHDIELLDEAGLEKYGDIGKTAAENEEERNEETLLSRDYNILLSIERERRLLDEKRVKWITGRMETITKETEKKRYRVNKSRKPASGEIEQLLCWEQYLMELLLLYEVNEWEQRFWKKLKAFLDQIGDDRVEMKEGLTRAWTTNYPNRLHRQMHAAEERLAHRRVTGKDKDYFLEILKERWASSISQLFEGVENPNSISLSDLRREMESESLDDEIRLRVENEIEDTQFRLERGSRTGRFDQFWDDDALSRCMYSRSKWLLLRPHSTVPLDIYSHALKGNKNIIHITFHGSGSDVSWFQATIRDLPWVTSIFWNSSGLPPIRDLLYIKSADNDLIKFAEEIRPKLDPFSTYIFTDAGGSDMYRVPGSLGNNARVLISFVAPTFGQSLILRLNHSGNKYVSLKVTLGSTVIQLNSKKFDDGTVDDITLYPIQDPNPESDLRLLSFAPEIRNDIVVEFVGPLGHHHILHDIELLDGAGLKYRNRIINVH